MRVLIVGSGGREHALAWKLAQEGAQVFAVPGNPGIASVATTYDSTLGELPERCKSLKPDLVIIGPENPLIDGLADNLRVAGITVFGPGADGAALEGSKAYSKDLMQKAGVPTARFVTCSSPEEARTAAAEFCASGCGVVIKASGLALGKGVVVCSSLEEANDAIEMMMEDRELGASGETVVVEQRLVGSEFSLLSICSGTSFVSLPVAQDHKRALDGDRGPNTGGMGSFSPVPWVTDEMVAFTEDRIVRPMLDELAARGIDYRGVLFSGLLVSDGDIYCLEYNVRFGDPEIQSLVRRLGPGFGELLLAAARGEDVSQFDLEILDISAVTVVMASPGYPGSYPKGIPLGIPEDDNQDVFFQAGTRSGWEQVPPDGVDINAITTNGGRVLAVSSIGDSLAEAREHAYRACERVEFEGGFYRSDIASLAG